MTEQPSLATSDASPATSTRRRKRLIEIAPHTLGSLHVPRQEVNVNFISSLHA
ncbi:MAG: hypothetical protein IPF48_13640 [Sphingomonadales bacterium]|nr:hypothetical protein [Sphingomonadales bacterium]